MHVRVIELMVAGVRRPREECLTDPGITGTLSIGDIPIGTAEKRPLHAAQLWEQWGSAAKRPLLPPLFDVQVLRMTPRGLLLRGFQVDNANWGSKPEPPKIPSADQRGLSSGTCRACHWRHLIAQHATPAPESRFP